MGNCFARKSVIIEVIRENDTTPLWSFSEDCCVCMENPVQTVLLECGHMNLCIKCAKGLSYNSESNLRRCPICRTDIKSFATFTPHITHVRD